MLIRYFMTTDVITLSPEQRCSDALKRLRDNHIRRAPVMDRGRLAGIVSERDLYRALARTPLRDSAYADENADTPVRQIMTVQVHAAGPNDHLEKAARLMLDHKIGGVPVLKEDKLAGMITESDIFKALWGILSHKTSCRILLFDKDGDKDVAQHDYIKLCLKHQCFINTFISYPRPEGGHMHYICVKGAMVDDLIKELWSCPCDIMFVEKGDG
ncbi:MAG: CBS domain-containing protein [Nitrospirota bacterium]|nr:CBS domain-containing protein [Nitrospirota bacterium]